MKIVKNLSALNEEKEKFAVTIGNFDGVHLGHQSILKQIKADCEKNDLKLVVVTFEPHPIQILRPRNHFLINSYVEKRDLLKHVGIEYLCEIEFTRDVSTMSPGDFLDDFILSCGNVEKLYLGHDFAFGANKSGNHEFVQEYCKPKNIEIVLLEEFLLRKHCVSSTEIRENINIGNIEKANEMLGRDFYISGRVVRGEGRGRKIGFPTANMQFLAERIAPGKGVYISRATLGDQVWNSITNVGSNPTFNTGNDLFVETHIIDFEDNIYGNEIRIEFIKKVRDEVKFNSVNDLIDQIKNDVEVARDFFKNA
ncbi:bifunctional riboflavin kinase/FAD synthetase [Halobacteriovorax sp. GB3]|uniref:bifunctional riboflavin kinase/FAD synthetase n=1 Tax=Halobacteriovorax sp. GB3 TaxID=2719615 RepID=UPI00235FA677|nr:bifunctional riboflavin kinase/FAD synthetase [Halobacteriovorax sp. GB3]MDD0854612.1 bifunctional riboflavin kinase/FAD synthetase [Halobacteriovorax sp. GB3]